MAQERIAVGLLLLALLAQITLGATLLSATFDETAHLPSGYTYLKTGDFRLNPQHPPLIKLLAATPLLALDPDLDLQDPAWSASPADEWAFGYRFLYSGDADRLLFWGRFPIALLGVLLAFYVYRWARALFGPHAGLTALTLCAFSPTVVAHSRFVTHDVGLACFSTLALFHLWRYLEQGRAGDRILAGVGLGLALASKYSGLVLIPVFVVLMLATWRDRGPGRIARDTAIVLALALVIVQATYFLSLDPLIYWRGLGRVQADHDPSYLYYMLGEFRAGGFWFYFPLAFLIKTPLPTLILLTTAVLLARRRAATALAELCLLLPILAYVAITVAFADNLGIRYLLPVYPLVFVYASRAAPWFLEQPRARFAIWGLGLWYAVSAALMQPDQLAYFNELVGGPANGHRYLDDSNIDWGQDLKRLQRYLDRNGIERVKLRYGRNIAPQYYGIRAFPISDAEWAGSPSPGLYAVGTHLLIRGEYYAETQGLATDWLSRYEPVARVGYSIYLFRFE